MSKTILITGATAGFGEACARKFAQDGNRLILIGRRAEKLEQLRDDLETRCAVLPLCLDVRDRAGVTAALTGLPEAFAAVDVLINNAGLALGLEPAHRADIDDWEMMVDTNIKGLMTITRILLPGMVERNRGHVVNLGSIAGTFPYPGGNVYGATKAFVEQFSRNLRADLLGTRVRVTVIEPGLARTEFSIVRFKGDTSKADSVYRGCEPLTALDIADIIYWVVSVPEHVNINVVEVMPTCQAWAPLAVHKQPI
ncbi:MAG: SDR family oxidoreductase [Thermodesulfobacteriota bacterium]